MYPGCGLMGLHPRERGQMSYAPHHVPGFGHVPLQTKMDTARPPVNYDPFTCYGSYGCPYPLPYHGCCYNQIPDYGLHYPHYAPPPPLYYHGSYPPLPGSHPFQYLPFPHYSAVDPRYEYDKKGPVDPHCCGCLNHLCQQKENKNVNIEEQTTDDEKDKVASSVPFELKDQPYPVLWIPPGHTRNEEGEQTYKPESKRETSSDKEAKECLKPCAELPGVWNRWLPIDLNKLNSLVQGRDVKRTEQQQNEDSKSSPDQKDTSELKDGDQKSIWDPSQYRFFPMKFIDNQDKKSMPEGDVKNIENSSSEDGSNMGDKNVVKKIIPVKQMDQSEEKILSKDVHTEENRAPKDKKNHSKMTLKHTDKIVEKEHSENISNVQSSFSKASKLPPVCLRVDPVRNRKTKGGSSRSPSPPANKKKSEMLSHDKSSSSSTMQGNNQQDTSSADSDLGRLQSGKKIKEIEVIDSIMRDNKIDVQKEGLSQSPVNASAGDWQEKVSGGCQDGKGVKGDQEFPIGDGVKNVDKISGEITKDNRIIIEARSGDVKRETGVNGGSIDNEKSEHTSTNGALNFRFSEAEAAAIIQSAYRGFEVRRWEPLKKLKEIARIEGELIKVRLAVQNLVSSSGGNIDKQKIVIGETIMNLLLQLDTMQGLHPSIRNIRKSVAKELVSLQETLDSITSQNLEELKESDISKHAGDISKSASEEGSQQAGEDIHEQDTSPHHMKSGVTEPCQDQLRTLMDVNISSVDTGKSELLSATEESRASEEKQPDSSGYVDLNWGHSEPLVELKEWSEVHPVQEDRDSILVESKELPPSIVAEEKFNPVQLQNLYSPVDSDWSSKEDEVAKVNTDVPSRVLEQNSNAQVFGECLQIDGRRCTVEPGKVELVQEPGGLILLGNIAEETSPAEQQHTELLAISPKLPDLEDNIATAVCSEGSSELKDNIKENISAIGDSERDKELGGEDMLGAEFVEKSEENHVKNIDKSDDDMLTAAVGVDRKEISDIKEAANAGEVDHQPDMHIADTFVVEMKETPEIRATVNVCVVEADDKPVDDMQTADTVGLEPRETLEVNKFGKDMGLVEDIQTIETCGLKLEDLSTVTSDLRVKQPNPSFVLDTVSGEEVHIEETAVSGEEVHIEETANCNCEQKVAVDEDQERWEDKFDNKEIHQKHTNGNIIYPSKDEDLVEEELVMEKVSRQPHGEFSTGKGDLAGEELLIKQPQKEVLGSLPILGQISSDTEMESDKKLVEENEKLKDTVEKLIAAGKEQLTAISNLSERVKDLEKKLSRKKKLKMKRHKSPSRYLLQV